MPIVPSLSTGKYIDNWIFSGNRVGIVGTISPKMSGGVHKKRKVQNRTVPERACDQNTIPVVFSPAVIGHLAGKEEDNIKGIKRIAHVLDSNQGIRP